MLATATTKPLTTIEFTGRDSNTVSFIATVQTLPLPTAEVRRLLGAHMTILQLVEGCGTITLSARASCKGSELKDKKALQEWFSIVIDEISQSVED